MLDIYMLARAEHIYIYMYIHIYIIKYYILIWNIYRLIAMDQTGFKLWHRNGIPQVVNHFFFKHRMSQNYFSFGIFT